MPGEAFIEAQFKWLNLIKFNACIKVALNSHWNFNANLMHA